MVLALCTPDDINHNYIPKYKTLCKANGGITIKQLK